MVYAVKAALTFIVNYWGHVLGVRIQADMRRKLFRHVETLPFSFFDENRTGTIMSRIVNDLFEVSELCHHGPEDTLMSVISIVGAIVMLALINGWLALIVVVFVPQMCIRDRDIPLFLTTAAPPTRTAAPSGIRANPNMR